MAPKSFLHLSTALKYGYDLQEMADIKESVGIIANDKEMQTEAANFINGKPNDPGVGFYILPGLCF